MVGILFLCFLILIFLFFLRKTNYCSVDAEISNRFVLFICLLLTFIVCHVEGTSPLSAKFYGITLSLVGLGENCPGQVVASGGLGYYSYSLVQPSGITDLIYTIDQTSGVMNVWITMLGKFKCAKR